MNKITIIILILLFQLLPAQKLEFFKQNIESKGSFVISTYSENYYKEVIKNSLPLLQPIKITGKADFEELSKLFPGYIEGQCLKVDEETLKPRIFKICTAGTKQQGDSTSIKVDGKLTVDSKLDEFYIFKYYFMEMGGYYLLNSKTQKIYHVFHEPQFSPDKTFIVVPFVDYHQFNLQIIDIESDRNLRYYLGDGRFTLNKIELAKIESFRKKVLFLNLTQKVEYDEDFQKIEDTTRNIRLLIQ